MSLNIKTDDGYISVAGGSVEPLKYTAITGAGVTVNNDPESTGYRTIENTGVHSIETGTDKDNANGTILVQTGVASATNPAKPIAVKGLNNAAYKDVDTTVDSTTKASTKLPTTKAVYDTLKKIEDGVFQRDTDAVSVKTVPSGVKNYAVVEKIYGKTVKNNLDASISNSSTQNTVTATKNSDGTFKISISATTTEAASFRIATDMSVKSGMKLVGCPSGGSSSTYEILVSDGTNTARDYGNGATINFNSDTAYVNMVIRTGVNNSSLIFKPMITDYSNASYDNYVQYGTLASAPIESVVSQSKNILNPDILKSFTKSNGNTITKTGSGLILNGTPTSSWSEYSDPFTLEDGTYTFRLNGNDTLTSNFTIRGYKSGTYTVLASATKINVPVSFTASGNYEHYVIGEGLAATIAYNNVFVTLQIIKSDTNINEVVPYFLNEIELSEAIKSLPDYGASCPSADGTGTVYNWIDFENGIYHHCVGSSDLSSGWGYNESGAYFYNSLLSSSKKTGEMNIIHAKYNTVLAAAAEMPDKSIKGASTSANIFLKDTSCGGSTTELVKALANTKCYYELAQEEIKNISDIIRPIKCETGGTITLKNEHNLDVANTIIYEKEVL